MEATAKTPAIIRWFRAGIVLAVGAAIAWFVYGNTTNPETQFPFKLGLDLAGGAHLVYEADVSKIAPDEVDELMGVLRDVIERRVNIFGVSEPVVYVESGSFVTENPAERLVVELPGVTDVAEAVASIGETPLLEFKLFDAERAAQLTSTSTATSTLPFSDPYLDTGLTGRFLASAALEFTGQQSQTGLANEPIVSINFNSEGSDLFAEITRDNTGEVLAIFLDGALISSPVINEPITGGTAIISGGFNPEEARDLAQNLNFGALPVPIELVSTQTVGATLGSQVLEKGIGAGIIGFALILVFMMLWYRVPGLVASVALLFYVATMLALFQFIPVVLTAAGLAGFILSLGMAVDANVLVFERMKEEYRADTDSTTAARTGFARAWSAIRDGNVTSLLSAIILFWFGTSIVKGFALVFGIGVLVSMLSALLVTRTLLVALPERTISEARGWLYNSGLKK